jgi:hypothetical protein
MRSFKDWKNSSTGKVDLEGGLYTNEKFDTKCTSNEIIVGLLGPINTLSRHLENYVFLGCKEENIYLVEWESDTYKALMYEVIRRNLKCKIIFGDIKEVTLELKSQGKSIYLVDFDGTDAVNDDMIAFSDLCIEEKISRYYLFVASARSGPKSKALLRTISDSLSLPRLPKWIHKPIAEQTDEEKTRKWTPKKKNQGEIQTIDKIMGPYFRSLGAEILTATCYAGNQSMLVVLAKIK